MENRAASLVWDDEPARGLVIVGNARRVGRGNFVAMEIVKQPTGANRTRVHHHRDGREEVDIVHIAIGHARHGRLMS